MDRGKDLFFLPTPFGRTRDLLLHLQYYQRCELIILKMWVKSKFVLWQSRYYNLLTAKNKKKIMFLKYSFFFENLQVPSVSRNSLQTPSLDHALLGNFTLSNSIILVEDLMRWKRGFDIFLIDYYADDIGNKNIAGKY